LYNPESAGDITSDIRVFREYAKILLSYNEKELTKAIKEKALIQVEANDG